MKEKFAKHKMMVFYLAVIIAIVALNISLPLYFRHQNEAKEKESALESESFQNAGQTEPERPQSETQKQSFPEVSEETQTVKGTEPNAKEGEPEMRLDNLSSFMSEKSILQLEEQTLKILPEGAKTVSCLDYLEPSAEKMNVTFYLTDEKGHVLKVVYDFTTAKSAVKNTKLTEADLTKKKKESEKEIQESEEKAKTEAQKRARDADRKKAEQWKRKLEREAQKEQQQVPQEAPTQDVPDVSQEAPTQDIPNIQQEAPTQDVPAVQQDVPTQALGEGGQG